MPAKKEVILQHVLTTDEEYHAMLNKDGMTVVDVYAQWCGPCKAIIPLFRRLRNELGDDLLRFAAAETDSIEALEEYRDRSEPTFLFIVSGAILVKVIRGPNGPFIEKTILSELKKEHQALEGQIDRVEFKDTFFEELAARRAVEEAAAEAERNKIVPIRRQLALVVVKPNIQEEQKIEIVTRIRDVGFVVLKQKELELSREDAEDLYSSLKEEDNFEAHMDHAVSGSCCVLVVSKRDVGESLIGDLRELIGPPDMEDALDNYPETLRAEFGLDNVKNAIHLSTSKISAEREIMSLFPKFKAPWVPGTAPEMQLAVLVVPPAHAENSECIVEAVGDFNCRSCRKRNVQLTEEDLDILFADDKEAEGFEAIRNQMLSGPSDLVLFEHEDVVNALSIMLKGVRVAEDDGGDLPVGCLRSKYVVDDVPADCLYAATALEQAAADVERFFPMQQTMAIVKPGAMDKKDTILEDVTALGFVVAISEERTLSQKVADQLYEEHKEKDFFLELSTFMSSEPVQLMVLSARDGIQAWRDALGPTDPNEAREHQPHSLRAKHGGEQIMENALHGSANVEDAKREIELLFGEEIEFAPDGKLQGEEVEEDAGEEGQPDAEGAEAAASADGAPAEGGDEEKPAEGEGEKPAEGEGEKPAEGEGEKPAEGEGEKPDEGDAAEKPAEGGNADKPAEGGESKPAGEGESGEAVPVSTDDQQQPSEQGAQDSSPEASAKPEGGEGADNADAPAESAPATPGDSEGGNKPAADAAQAATEENPAADGKTEETAAPADAPPDPPADAPSDPPADAPADPPADAPAE